MLLVSQCKYDLLGGVELKIPLLNPFKKYSQKVGQRPGTLVYLGEERTEPVRMTIIEILDDEIPLLGENTHPYFRDVYDHLIQAIQMLGVIRSSVLGLFNIYTSAVSHRMNEVMKVLIIVATFFIPLTFITGIYGMNFKFMPH